MNRIITVFLLSIVSGWFTVKAQELNAKVTINSDRIQGTNKDAFTTLQSALTNFVNGTKWSSSTFSTVEKIDCTFSIVILTQSEENQDSYTAEMTILARRPVYNSSYTTNLLNFRDTQFDFEYVSGTPIDYTQNIITTNLVAVISFYCNLILGLDFDSFSPVGGSYFLRQAQSISLQAQSNPWTGWAAFESTTNRHAVISALMDESLAPYRNLWYTYHRKGLDEMAANPDRGRTTIINALPVLDELRNMRSSVTILQLFADCKLDEIVAMCSKATSEEKTEIYDLLSKLYPTMTDRLEPLKK